MMGDAEGQIVEQLKKSAKYRNLCDETLSRMATWALARYPSPKGATKAAKRKLHQVYGAYVGQVDVRAIHTLMDELNRDDPKPVCEAVLKSHVSTAERFGDVADVFEAIWNVTGRPERVMDLACGLNPFALPWMGDLKGYLACDIDVCLADCISKFFENIGFDGESVCHDLLVTVPQWQADVVFLLKVLPCLEQQEKGASQAILKQIRAQHIVVSFPAQSMGGQEKGMVAHYGGFITQLADELGLDVQDLPFDSETYYVLSHR